MTPMTDDELIEYLGLRAYSEPTRAKFIAEMTKESRETYDRMREAEQDIKLWQEGVGPKPTGVILCHDHTPKRRRSQSDTATEPKR